MLLPGEFHGQKSLGGYSPWDQNSRTQLSDYRFYFQVTLFLSKIILSPHLPIIAPYSFKKDFKKSACLFLKLIAILKYWNLSNMIEKYCTNLNKYSIIIY